MNTLQKLSLKTVFLCLGILIAVFISAMLPKSNNKHWQNCDSCTVWKSNNDTMKSGYYSSVAEMPEEKYIDQLIEFEELVYMYHIKFPDICIAQAYLESGYLTSQLFYETNNPFGMKVAKNRPTTNFGDYNGYAIYSSLKDAVADYAIWQNGLPKSALQDTSAYFEYLSSNYASDTNYVSKLMWIINNQLHF